MKTKIVRRLLRGLIALLGAGVGAALTLGALEMYTLANPSATIPMRGLISAYICLAALGGLIFFLVSPKIIDMCGDWGAAIVKRLDGMSFSQLAACTIGLIAGLLIAALVSQILTFMGASIFTTAFSAILYVMLGLLGLNLGRRRTGDVASLLERAHSHSSHRLSRRRHHEEESSLDAPLLARPKLLDTSALIDGRVLDVCRTGFIEGELVVPAFVLGELKRIAGSSDPLRRTRGRRGLDVLEQLRQDSRLPLRVDNEDDAASEDADTLLLRLAKETGSAIVTGDHSLTKAAAVMGVPVMNLNELAGALRPAVVAGEDMTLSLVKAGREPGQGVGYLDDGTMVVVEGGAAQIGSTAEVTVTSALQTNAGRMIFARLKERPTL